MESFQADCPRCHTRAAAFQIIATIGTDEHNPLWDVFASCNVCRRAIVATYRTPVSPDEMPSGSNPVPLEIAPGPSAIGAPAHTPDTVDHFFRQGRSSLQAGNYDAAGVMYRKALEIALKLAFPKHKDGLSLAKRIDTAKTEGGLTKDLAEWAHTIRGLGNEAAHEDDPFSQDDAETIDQFTELMLTYVFTLPGRLAQARGGTDNVL